MSTTPLASSRRAVAHHLLALKVENRAGVLVRIAGLFARRGFNIVSLVVAPTGDERFSRVSIVVDVESVPLQQILDQLSKLVNVVEIREIAPDAATERELLLATVTVEETSRATLLDALAEVGGIVVDEDAGVVTVMVAGHPDQLDSFAARLDSSAIVELQRTGSIALPKLD
ncbi:MAG TPA: acetolactate synthase small subunit [Acidimicrobiales bacterium]